MVSLSDPQLKIIMTAANTVPVERRSVFWERCGAMLRMRGRFSDDDVADVVLLGLPVSLVRRLLPQRQYFGRQSWLLHSKPVLRRWIRGAKAKPETSRSPVLTGARSALTHQGHGWAAAILNPIRRVLDRRLSSDQ
jgi:hypothetical protein